MEYWLLVVLGAVVLVLGTALKLYARRTGRTLRSGSTADERQGSTTGTYVVAAFFAGFGLLVLLFDPMGRSRSDLPNWLLAGALVLIGIALVVLRRRGARRG